MTTPAPDGLLVDHPALPIPLAGRAGLEPSYGGEVAAGRLSGRQRQRLAVQLLAATAAMAEFDLWPGSRSLAGARAVEREGGLQAVIAGFPRSLAQLTRRLGGGEQAADIISSAAGRAVAAATGVSEQRLLAPDVAPAPGAGAGLSAALADLPYPLDPVTARNLWALRWDPPPVPDPDEVLFWGVPMPMLAMRFAAAQWSVLRRRRRAAWLRAVSGDDGETGPLPPLGTRGTLIVAGAITDSVLAAVDRWSSRPGCGAVVIGEFPAGWRPPPPPGFDPSRPARHLAITGGPEPLCRRAIDRCRNRFDPFCGDDRDAVTEHGRRLWRDEAVPAVPTGDPIDRWLALAPEGVPEGFLTVQAGVPPTALAGRRTSRGIVVEGDRWRLARPPDLLADPAHQQIAALFAPGDPRRLRHLALADGHAEAVVAWAARTIADLDGHLVREVLGPVSPGELGIDARLAVAHACLAELDPSCAARALEGLTSDRARPYRRWLEAIDNGRPPSELPSPEEVAAAPRACAEIARLRLRAELRRPAGDPAPARTVLLACRDRLEGAERRLVELEQVALSSPERLADAGWRREVVGGHPALRRRWMHLRALRLMERGRHSWAERLLRSAARGERAPARLGMIELDLAYADLERGRSRDASNRLLRAYRLLGLAGFTRRTEIVLFDLAVCDLDLLRVERATRRLDDLAAAGGGDDLFVLGEQIRLALAVGDEAGFRHRLARFPATRAAGDPRFDEHLSLLRGIEALLDGDRHAARRLLERGGQEGALWLAVVDGLEGRQPIEHGSDQWGLATAASLAFLCAGGRSGEAAVVVDARTPLTVTDALAVALVERLLGPLGWVPRSTRRQAARVLDGHSLSGWGRVMRRATPDAAPLVEVMTMMIDRGGPAALDDEASRRLVGALGLGGIEVASLDSGDTIWRWGSGAAGDQVTRGRLVVTPLGGDAVGESGFDLLLRVLDLLQPVSPRHQHGANRELGLDGTSPAVRELRRQIRQFAPTHLGVLLRGETGTGKEVAAQALHRLSGRPGELVPVNVAAIPPDLLEAELFGSVRGAFTGAVRSRRGLVDAAGGGTLFLDEIGDLEISLQVKLLRFLESQEVRPVGADTFHRVDVRIVSATHQDLDRRVANGGFRPDLFYRIATVPIIVPPLRERTEDIPLLRARFEAQAIARCGVAPCRWSSEAEAALARYHWPGNVRELRHVVEVAMVRAAGAAVQVAHLPLATGDDIPGGRWDEAVTDFRRRFLAAALRRHHGNRSAAARELGISRQALLYHVRNLGLGDGHH